jgi:AraC-like DNA-binding protein
MRASPSTDLPDRVLRPRTLLRAHGVVLDDVVCHGHRDERFGAPEPSGGYGVVLVRRGCFRRRTRHGDAVLEPSHCYVVSGDGEQQVAHPHDGGDACTALFLDEALFASLLADTLDPAPATGPTPPGLDLEHRLLAAAAARGGEDAASLAERAVNLVADVLALHEPRRIAAGRPRTAQARRRAVAAAREALAADAGLGLPQLAALVHVSPHHLSRTFRAETGLTVSAYRTRLRVRQVLERLAGGERDLARLARDAGFADQSHMTRAVRAEAGRPPGALRALLSA